MDMTERFERCAQELWEHYSSDFRKPVVAVAGAFNTGKSTLINSLLGTQLSPVDVVPTTTCPIYFHFGESFTAQLTRKMRKVHMDNISDFIAYLRDKVRAASLERIDLWWPAELLKKCTLVDTPGIDSISPKQHSKLFMKQAQTITEQVIAGADKVLYIFHQRGLNEFERKFLWQIKPWWEKSGRKALSFWINCNLQGFDGTSLHETRSAVREIFGPSIAVHTLNTRDSRSIKLVRQILDYELAVRLMLHLEKQMKDLDSSIPQRLKKLTGIDDEISFLTSFWQVKSIAELVLNVRQSMDSIPRIMQKLRHSLHEYDITNLRQTHKPLAPGKQEVKTVNLASIKEMLIDLLVKMMFDSELRGLLNPRELGDLAGRVRDEEFLVVAAGPFSSGKTTFFNALMKEMLLPAENKPTTSCITSIKYGTHPKARVYLKHQVTLPIYEMSEGKAQLRREELLALRKWLEDLELAEDIAKIEVNKDEDFTHIDKDQLSVLLEQTISFFDSGVISLNHITWHRPLPALVRRISVKKLGLHKAVKSVRLTFRNADTLTFDLDKDDERAAFYRYLSLPNALRIGETEVLYPAELLKLASFIDTPGFDSTYRYHREITDTYLRKSDAYLLFLNGKHILTDMDRQNILQILKEHMKHYLTSLTPQQAANESEKFFVVINFADTLSTAEKEKVVNYVRQNIYFSYPGGTGFFAPQVYLISSLAALSEENLSGDNNEGFRKLTRKLERTLLKRRGEEILRRHIEETRAHLLGISQDRGHETSKYLNELNDIERLLGKPGGVRIWKMQGH